MFSDGGINEQLRWNTAKENPPSMAQVCLAAIAELVSYLIATLFRLPEAYWAPMSTLIVMHLTLSAALPVGVQYVAGAATDACFTEVCGRSPRRLSSSDSCALYFVWREVRFDMQALPSRS
jgi:hypothetical protein